MRGRNLADMSREGSDVRLHSFNAREEVGVGEDCWAGGNILHVLTWLHGLAGDGGRRSGLLSGRGGLLVCVVRSRLPYRTYWLVYDCLRALRGQL